MFEHPFPIPAEVEKKARFWFDRLTELPDSKMYVRGPDQGRGGPLMFDCLEDITMCLYILKKGYRDIINDGGQEFDRLWPSMIALEVQAARIHNLVEWARVTWPYDPAVLARLGGNEASHKVVAEQHTGIPVREPSTNETVEPVLT